MIYTVTLNPSIDFIVHVDNLAIGDLNKMTKDYKFPGGKGINVSRVLHRLDTPSTALGFLGGFTGGFIKDSLEKEGLSLNFTPVKEDTRINIKLKDRKETEINGLGRAVTQEEVDSLKATLVKVTSGDIVVFSGSLPPSLSLEFYQELIAIVVAQGGEFVIDTTGESLLTALPSKPLLIKPNNHELADLFETTFHSTEDIILYGKKLMVQGAKNVLVSMGKDGALLINKTGIYQSNVLKGTLKNSVGAGDSMVAGFISQLSHGNSTIEAFRYGVAAGSGTAFSDDLATAETIKALLKDVIITTLSENREDISYEN